MIVRMWVAHVAPGRTEDALAWVRRDLVPRLLLTEGCMSTEILRGTGNPVRVVVTSRWDSPPRFEEGVPDDGVLTSARAYHFETV